MMKSIQLKAHAKVNLALDIIGKRSDGYHEVRMIMQSIGLHDQLSIYITNDSKIRVQTNLPFLPTNQSNIVYKAASLIKRKFQLDQGLYINLNKRIPVSAGLAGGSTDAAATLHGLNQLFDLKLSLKELMDIGVELGADVPFCLLGGTALSEGIGEKLTPLHPFPPCHILVVNPNFNVPTKNIYRQLNLNHIKKRTNIDDLIKNIKEDNLHGATKNFSNVLETVTVKNHPLIQEIKDKMMELGAITSIMSGSGPTVFGIYDDLGKAKEAFYHFKVDNFEYQVFLTKPYS